MLMGKQGDMRRRMRGLVLTTVLIISIMVIIPSFPEHGEAVVPRFTRPNVLIDQGSGSPMAPDNGGPSIAHDLNGTLHAAWSDRRTGRWGIYYAHSYDGGTTWIDEKKIDGFNTTDNFAPSIAVDTTRGPYSGRIYVVWQYRDLPFADIYFILSTDGGANWTNKRRIDTAGSAVGSTSPQVVVNTDGRVYAAFEDSRYDDLNIFAAKSEDGGVTWFREVRVSPSYNDDDDFSLMANGDVYLAWKATRIRKKGPHDSYLMFAYSSTLGVTWNSERIIPIPAGDEDAYSISITVGDPWVAGVPTVHVAWVMVSADFESSVVYSQSLDYGETWSSLVRVDDAPQGPAYTHSSVNIVQSSNVLYVFWADDRNGDSDIFISWSEDNGMSWSDGLDNNNDLRVDDTDENAASGDDASDQLLPSVVATRTGVYIVWSDDRDLVAHHVYFATFEFNVLITEIRDSPDGLEQIEIHNQGSKLVDLTGWSLHIDGIAIPLDPLTSISSGAYLTIGDDSGTSDLVVDITLGDEGGTVQLFDSSGLLRDDISYGQLGPVPDPLDSESVARVVVNSTYSGFWTRSIVPTFSSSNTGLPPVRDSMLVLNEVVFNTGNPNDRFIELFLREGTSIDLTGHTLVGDAPYTLPVVVLTATTPYYIVRAAMAPALFGLMDAPGDNIYLYNPSEALMDMVGWSSLHTQDASMMRIPDGFGTPDGYNDTSSAAAGWQFDRIPSLSLILIGAKQTKSGDPGDHVVFSLNVTNSGTVATYVNIEARSSPLGWSFTLLESDGVTLLTDSPGDPDSIPDVGLLPPASRIEIKVAVDIPVALPSQSWDKCQVTATDSSDSRVSSSTILTTNIYAHVFPLAYSNPKTIFLDGSPIRFQPQETTLTIRIAGRGTAAAIPKPQDTVLLIDSSGSMGTNDPSNLRKTASKHYVDLLVVPDRAAVVDFDSDAFLVGGDHLSSNYPLIKSNIDLIDSSGGTDIYLALIEGNNELIDYGDSTHIWIEILLTDGHGGSAANILAEAQRAAANGIIIYTIGLGNNINEPLLRDVADITGGMYMKALVAEDLDAIYQAIGESVRTLAGYDDNTTDDIPMVNVFLPSYINYVPGSGDPTPDYIGQIGGKTNLQWNVTRLSLNETWTARLNVTSNLAGTNISAMSYPDSMVTYIRYDDTHANMSFPAPLIDVIAPILYPDLIIVPSDISLSLPPFIEETPLYVNATIHSIGDIPSNVTTVRYHNGPPPSPQIGSDQPLSPINVGATETVSVLWTPTNPGNYKVCIVIDPDDLLVELNESNNMACIDLSVDLKPDYVPFEPMPTMPIILGLSKDVDLSIAVLNQRAGNATSISTVAFFNESTPLAPFAQFTVPALVGNTNTSSFTSRWTAPATSGTYRIVACMDYNNVLVEYNEDNNNFTWIIQVVDGPITTLDIGLPSHVSNATYITSSTPLGLSVTDRSGLGITRTIYRIDGGAWQDFAMTGPFALTVEGSHTLEWYSEDNAGNIELSSSMGLIVDDTPPVVYIDISQPMYVTTIIFITSASEVNLSASDRGLIPVGLRTIEYRIDGGAWNTYTAPFTLIEADGYHTIMYTAKDLLENIERTHTINVVLDNTPPVTTIQPSSGNYTVDTLIILTAIDEGCGLNVTLYRIDDGGWTEYNGGFRLPIGEWNITYKSSDYLANQETEKTLPVVIRDVSVEPPEMNYKPIVALIFAFILLLLGIWSANQRPWKDKKDQKAMFKAFCVVSLPFLVTEVATGVVSLLTGLLSIPPLLGIGMIVDLLILLIGAAVAVHRFKKKPLQSEKEEVKAR